MTAPSDPYRLAGADLQRLYSRARAERWGVDVETFAATLQRCLRRAGEAPASARQAVRQADALQLEDLALATACAHGHEGAWEHFVREYRPVLYRAADALDPGGAARELADGLYADLYGLRDGQTDRRSLFAYYHGRSTLGTWLRAVLAQRLVDRARTAKRVTSLPDDAALPAAASPPPDPAGARHVVMLQAALAAAIASLAPADRLRLQHYYRHGLTLAQIGRMAGEHEATVSRHLTRTRRTIRDRVVSALREQGVDADSIASAIADSARDAGTLDLEELLSRSEPRKVTLPERS